MNKKAQRILVLILALAMLLTVLVPILSAFADASITQNDINNIKGELSDVTAAKKEAQAQLNAIRGDKSQAAKQITLLQNQIILTEHEITTSQRLLDQYDLEIQAREEELAALETEEEQRYAEFCSHVRWMEETGSISYLSILFQAGSFSELLDYTVLITDIMEYSNGIIDGLKNVQQEVTEARNELQTIRNEQADIQLGFLNQLAELEAMKVEADALYASLSQNEAELAAQAKKLAEEEVAIQKQLKKAEEQYAAQIAALQTSGEWYWPLPGHLLLSSLFGARKDPFTGKADNHTGIDIPANSGTEIHAAQSGVVTFVETNRYATSYGYYIIISHGNGKSTLYAHMKSKAIVKTGQTVKKGQVIGYVGSTGRSTGPHLHFEYRINGIRADAVTLYPGVTFRTYSGAKIKGGTK